MCSPRVKMMTPSQGHHGARRSVNCVAYCTLPSSKALKPPMMPKASSTSRVKPATMRLAPEMMLL